MIYFLKNDSEHCQPIVNCIKSNVLSCLTNLLLPATLSTRLPWILKPTSKTKVIYKNLNILLYQCVQTTHVCNAILFFCFLRHTLNRKVLNWLFKYFQYLLLDNRWKIPIYPNPNIHSRNQYGVYNRVNKPSFTEAYQDILNVLLPWCMLHTSDWSGSLLSCY